jgi:hypothetical protein
LESLVSVAAACIDDDLAPVVEPLSDFCHITRSNFPLVVDTMNAAAARQRKSVGGDDEDGMRRHG